MNSDDEIAVCETLPEMVEIEKVETLNLLPEKSRIKYEFAYKRFMNYRQTSNANSYSENVLVEYFIHLSAKMKPSTLWANYSMLRSTLNIKDNVDISKYQKLRAFLKRKSLGYKANKPKTLTVEQIEQFLLQAPDDTFLMTKVAVIFGVAGACRRDELTLMNLNHIEDLGNKLLISIPDNKMNKQRSFIVNETFMDFYRKYTASRPINFDSSRFFFKYTNGKGFRQVVGVHKFGKIPQTIATFLKLPNPQQYTGHCFRRSSATILVDSGLGLASLKRRAWKSSAVVEGYSNKRILSVQNTETANKVALSAASTSQFEYVQCGTTVKEENQCDRVDIKIETDDIAIKEEPLDDIPPMEDVQIIAKMEPLDVDCNDISFFQNFVPYLNKLTSIQKARVYTKIHHLILEEIS